LWEGWEYSGYELKKKQEGIKMRNEKFCNLYTIKTYLLKFHFNVTLPNKAMSQK